MHRVYYGERTIVTSSGIRIEDKAQRRIGEWVNGNFTFHGSPATSH